MRAPQTYNEARRLTWAMNLTGAIIRTTQVEGYDLVWQRYGLVGATRALYDVFWFVVIDLSWGCWCFGDLEPFW